MVMKVVLMFVVCALGCSRGKPPSPAAGECYSTEAATACPADPSDPSGKGLPAPGGPCRLEPCRTCGSATAPAFRGPNGAPQPGWCFCVPKSDDSGATYSCFTLDEWRQRR
jgi:hypothetical protein